MFTRKNILGSVMGPLLFSIYMNDFPNVIKSICKIFGDDKSLFSKVKHKTYSDIQLNNDLNKIGKIGLIFDSKLDFDEYKYNKINQCNKIIVIMTRL